MKQADIRDVPLSYPEVVNRIRRLASFLLLGFVSMHVIKNSGGFKADVFQYHPICMMVAFVIALPDVVSGVRQLKKKPRRKTGAASTAPLPRSEVILRHQLCAFIMEVFAAGGFAAVEYTKVTKNYPHLMTPHSIIGAVCGGAIATQMVLGSVLRYVLAAKHPTRPIVVKAHGLMSLTIALTGLICIAGGLLSTTYAESIIPSAALRKFTSVMAVVAVVVSFFQ